MLNFNSVLSTLLILFYLFSKTTWGHRYDKIENEGNNTQSTNFRKCFNKMVSYMDSKMPCA